MRNLPEVKVDMVWKALTMAKHSAMHDEVDRGRLLDREMCKFGM